MRNNESYNEIQKKFPEYVKFIEKRLEQLNINFIFFCVFSLGFFLYFLLFNKLYLQKIYLIYTLIGTFLVSAGALKSKKQFALLNVARWGYNKDLANDMMIESYLMTSGLFMLIIALSIAFIVSV